MFQTRLVLRAKWRKSSKTSQKGASINESTPKNHLNSEQGVQKKSSCSKNSYRSSASPKKSGIRPKFSEDKENVPLNLDNFPLKSPKVIQRRKKSMRSSEMSFIVKLNEFLRISEEYKLSDASYQSDDGEFED